MADGSMSTEEYEGSIPQKKPVVQVICEYCTATVEVQHKNADEECKCPMCGATCPNPTASSGMTSSDVCEIQHSAAKGLGLPVRDELDLGGGAKLDLVLIPPGSFLMGSPGEWEDDEGPQHKVTISRPFYMGATQVTQSQWRSVRRRPPRNSSNAHQSPTNEVCIS